MNIFKALLKIHLCLLLAFSSQLQSSPIETSTNTDILGFKVKTGTAEGYIEDKACQSCHPKKWKTYQHVGMSKSFVKPSKEHFIEDFNAPDFYHAPSQRYYKIRRVQDELFFYRYQLDTEGAKINEFTRKIDWILGSGNKTRSYLYQTKVGEIFQLPLGWYSQQQKWLMGPGYEKKDHIGVQRLIRRECMFCHNAFPENPAGSDSHWQPHQFPKDLPEGTGCQRCHGPGVKHIKSVLDGSQLEKIKAAIINPAKLTVKNRDSVCFQCHMLPAVSVIGMRRFSRNDFSFRPGELITDFIVNVDVKDPELAKEDRFEINHHAYRLTQSKCFTKSLGKLTCISCHNPHKKVSKENAVVHYEKVCLSCHQKHKVTKGNNADDCIACHMPQRRTQDVIHVAMTDHKIQVNTTTNQQRLAAVHPKEPIIEAIDFLMPESSPTGIQGELYKTIILLRTVTTVDALNHLEKIMARSKNIPIDAYLDLANAQIKLKRYKKAQQSLNTVFDKKPNDFKALQLMGIVHISQKQFSRAEKTFNKALKINPQVAELYFNYGILYLSQNKFELAQQKLKKALKLRPNMIKAWQYSAKIHTKLAEYDQAIIAYKKLLSIDPSHPKIYLNLAKLFLKQNIKSEAIRYLKHGIKINADNSKLKTLLKSIQN